MATLLTPGQAGRPAPDVPRRAVAARSGSLVSRVRAPWVRWTTGPRRLLAAGGARVARWWDQVTRIALPVTDRLAPILAAITPLGGGSLAVVVVSGAVAVWLGWVELGALAAVLLLALATGVAFVLGRPAYDVTVDLASLRVVVGERAVGEVRVRSAADKSVAPSLIELPVGRAVAAFPVPRLDPGQEHEELFTIPTQRRAVLPLGPVRSVRQDPLELLRREVTWTEPEVIYVHPRTVRLENSSSGFVRDLEGLTTKNLTNDDLAFHALREYMPGDDLRHVHWRSTARTNQLMIRQFEETRRSQFVILLDTRAASYADEDEFELAVSIAASMSRSAQMEGKEVTVFTAETTLVGPTPASLLDAYSAIDPSTSRESIGDRARVVAAESPGASVVALVSGSATPIEQLRVAAIRVPSMARCFAIRAAMAGELGRKSVGDFTVVTVPSLDDLGLAVRVVTA